MVYTVYVFINMCHWLINTTVIVTINNIVFAYVFKSHHKVVLKPSLHCQALIQGLYIGLHDSEIEVRVTASHIGLTNLVLEHIQCVTWLKKKQLLLLFPFLLTCRNCWECARVSLVIALNNE